MVFSSFFTDQYSCTDLGRIPLRREFLLEENSSTERIPLRRGISLRREFLSAEEFSLNQNNYGIMICEKRSFQSQLLFTLMRQSPIFPAKC